MERAVLTSAVGQNVEYIVDGESGLLAAPRDEIDFAVKLDQLLSQTELRALLGSNARQRLWQKFQWSGDALQQCLAAYEYAKTRQKAGVTSPAVTGASDSIRQRSKSAA